MPHTPSLEEVLRAVDGGKIDALLVGGAAGGHLFALKGSDQAYRVLVEEMAESALTLTPDGTVAYANQRFATLLGQPLQTVIGSAAINWFAPDAHAQFVALLAEGLGHRCSAELDLLTATAQRVPVLASFSPLNVPGLSDAVCLIATDLTVQKRSEAALLARENLLKMIEAQRHAEEMLRESIATLRLHDSALEAVSQAVVISDAARRITYVNPAFEAITGYTESEVIGINCKFLQGPKTDSVMLSRLNTAMAHGQLFHGEILNYRKDGSQFWNELSINPVLDARGVITQFVAVQRDVTARRQADEDQMLAARVLDQSSEGFIVTDAERRIVKVNQAFTTISGFTEIEALGQPLSMLNSDHHDGAFIAAKWAEVQRTGGWEGEVWKRHKDGPSYPQWQTLRRMSNASGETTHYIATFVDISHRKAAEAQLLKLAHYDTLTGLPNRLLLQECADYALKLAERGRIPLALLFFDVDHFKNINDSMGHRVGDLLLVALAERLQSILRDQDCLARLGGDEFILILPDTDTQGAMRVAQKMLAMTQTSFQLEQQDVSVSISIGCAIYPSDATNFETLASCADAAMYRAKQSGRNMVRFHTPEMQAQVMRTVALESGLRKALALDQLQLHYQPQKSLVTGNIVGAEALLRWTHPEFGAVSPAEFIPIAENCGLMTTLGSWVLHTAVFQLKAWLDMGMAPITMAINLSAVQFRQADFPELIQQTLEASGIPAHLLELELTESVALDDPIGAINTMRTLHALGLRMSIDDFGTGYSSLSYLKQFQVNKLKIDQSFVRNLVEDRDDQAIVNAIIGMAQSLGLQTIAEGVETEAQMIYLREHGCQEIQGYWLGRPMPSAQFESFMRTYLIPHQLS